MKHRLSTLFIVIAWALIFTAAAHATSPTKEPEKQTPSTSSSGSEASANATQGQSQNTTLAPEQSAAIDFDYPEVAAIFGMGHVGGEDAPVSNGPCPLWVPEKPSRSFPGHGRGPKYIRDEACWLMTETELSRAYDLELERIQLERERVELESARLELERIRLESCLTCGK